jgi:hypothetical protein
MSRCWSGFEGSQWGKTKERGRLEDLDVDGRIILKWVLKNGRYKWIPLAQDRDKWQALVKTMRKLLVA